MTVVACNEKEQDDVSPSVRNVLHQECIVIEKKGIDGFRADNLSLTVVAALQKLAAAIRLAEYLAPGERLARSCDPQVR
jgi:hypothetical protein